MTDYLEQLEEAVELAFLPNWLVEHLPKMRPTLTIVRLLNADAVEVFDDNGENYGKWKTVAEAYQAVNSPEICVAFHESVNGYTGVLEDDCFFIDHPETSKVNFLNGLTDQKLFKMLKDEYLEWLDLDQQWRRDPKNWVLSYQWLQRHPAFWIRATDEPTYFWDTIGGVQDMEHDVAIDEDEGDTLVMLNLPSRNESLTDREDDLRLDVLSSTFEEALVDLAEVVEQVFDVDGSERRGRPTKKAEWEEELKQRLRYLRESDNEE